MDTKFPISLMFFLVSIIIIMNNVTLIMSQNPSPRRQSHKCSKKNFDSDAKLKYRETAFAMLYKDLKERKHYSGYMFGYGSSEKDFEIWSICMCPPNIKKEDCLECVNTTIPHLAKNCPNQKQGVVWTVLRANVLCMVRYDDFFSQNYLLDWGAWGNFSSESNQTTPASAEELEKGVNKLADDLKEDAAIGGRSFGVGDVRYDSGSGSGSRSLYGAMQCTPDIGGKNCTKCLTDATNEIHKCCTKERKLFGITLSTNCYFWYSHEQSLTF